MKLKKVSSMILAVTLACTMTVTPVLADEVSDYTLCTWLW